MTRIDRLLRALRIAPGRTPAGSHVGRFALPLSVSLAVHALLAIALAGAAWTITTSRTAGGSAPEVFISLDNPAPAPVPATEPSSSATPAPPAPTGSAAPAVAPPTLEGLSSAPGPAPALRSAAEGGSASLESALRSAPSVGATFAGAQASRAVRIVYVVDASGAMVSSLKFVLDELERSIQRLTPEQRFQVILFRRPPGDAAAYELFTPPGQRAGREGLIPATAVNKAAVAAWLRTIQPIGRSDPEAGLVRALEFRPDVVFLLSRSIQRSTGEGVGVWGRGTSEILAQLDRLNPADRNGRRPTAIKTIQFVEEDPTGTMQAIGRAHGGGADAYRVLTLEELGSP